MLMMSNALQDLDSRPSVKEFFAGKSVALTGATGFIGKLLIEKLLRSCPEIKQIFVLIRSKNGFSCNDRLKKIIQLPIFNLLKSIQPEFSSKLIAIPCDIEKENLGLSSDCLIRLTTEVNIFFHSAATLKFNEHLKLSHKINTVGVRRMLGICRKISNLHAIVHVSTAYSFCNYKTIEEEIYPTGFDHDELDNSMQWMTGEMIEKLTPDVLGERPNTYTLTKAFGEEVIAKEGVGLPICIIRPSIVGATYKEPIPGWCDNINGPTGLFIAYGKGYLRILCNSAKSCIDVIPADYVTNGIVAAAWKTALSESSWSSTSVSSLCEVSSPVNHNHSSEELKSFRCVKPSESVEFTERRKSVPIYHFVANTAGCFTVTRLCDMVCNSYSDYPLDNVFRSPYLITSISNKYFYRTISFILEYLPACLIDAGRLLIGQKPKAVRLTHRMTSAQDIFQYFMSHTWVWKGSNTIELEQELSNEDRKEFFFNPETVDWNTYIKNYCIGTRKYILKEDPKDYPAARRHVWRLRVLGWIAQFGAFVVFWRFLVSRSGIGKNLWHLFMSLWFKFLRFFQISSTLHRRYIFSKLFSA